VDERTRAHAAEEILTRSNAVIRGDHFVYITGQHGDGWIDKDAIFPDTTHGDRLGALLAAAAAGRDVEIVCGPATGGLIVSQWTAHHLAVPSVFADHGKERGYDPRRAVEAGAPLRPPFVLGRGYDRMVAGKRVLVVDDVVNTGESLAETTDAVRTAGGEVVAVGALCTRGNADAGAVGCDDFFYLLEVEVPSWPAKECELCRRRVPISTRYAHGADYLAAHPDYPAAG
jgi:orotate phosphoribosyltransferase